MRAQRALWRMVARALGEIFVFYGVHQRVHHGLVVEELPGIEDLAHARVRLGSTRHEERAAVRGRL